MTSEAINLLLPGFCTYHTCWRSSNNGYDIAYVDMPKTYYVTACDSYRDIMGVFHLQKKFGNFLLGFSVWEKLVPFVTSPILGRPGRLIDRERHGTGDKTINL